ncbi:MAG: hypothetical protein ACRCWR_09705 [Saezia sp.]
MSLSSFDAKTEVLRLKLDTKTRRYRSRQSCLKRFEAEILALWQEGASVAEIQRWLASHRLRVVHSTISRWLKKHPAVLALQSDNQGQT